MKCMKEALALFTFSERIHAFFRLAQCRMCYNHGKYRQETGLDTKESVFYRRRTDMGITQGVMEEERWLNQTLDLIVQKMEWVSAKNKEKIPYTTDAQGNYDDLTTAETSQQGYSIDWWTNGFWAGVLWKMYNFTQKKEYAYIARQSEDKLDTCLMDFNCLHHDVGFMYLLTGVADYRLTGSEGGRRRGLHAATILAGRFNPVGNFIRAWNEWGEDTRGWAIIDCMMNLSLLYWASEETKDPRFRQIAMLHADTTMEHFVRKDGSVNHIVEFNPETGKMVRTYGGQGYGDSSSWTRGQAWAIYGFVISYLHTEKEDYLNTAKRIAHYFIANLDETCIVPIDFRQPEEPALEDSCAACIAASALIELSNCVMESEKAMYRKAAIRLLRTISEKRACWGKESDAIVMNCSSAYHNGDHHIAMVYGDYFFIEAILKLADEDIMFW